MIVVQGGSCLPAGHAAQAITEYKTLPQFSRLHIIRRVRRLRASLSPVRTAGEVSSSCNAIFGDYLGCFQQQCCFSRCLSLRHLHSQSRFDVYPQSQTDYLPGTFVILANPATGQNYLASITDPIWGITQTGYVYAAALDTGSSGNVISATEAQGRNLPTTNETYSDQGIGGQENFNVSTPTTIKLAAVDSGAVQINLNSVTRTLTCSIHSAARTINSRFVNPIRFWTLTSVPRPSPSISWAHRC